MDALILLGTLFMMVALGVPVAYSLGVAAIVGAFWIDIPLEAVMLKISDGVSKFSLLAIPFWWASGLSFWPDAALQLGIALLVFAVFIGAFAIGASHALDNGKSVLKVGLTYDASEHVGANAGVGIQF